LIEEIDIWRTAAEMRRQFGADAAVISATRADALLDQGDIDGFNAWKRIVAAINDLERTAPARDDTVN
jgi:hypothetical protein